MESYDPQELGRRGARAGQAVADLLAHFTGSEYLPAVLTAYVAELKALIYEEAERDALTQLGNRAAFNHHLAAERARALRYGRVLTLVLLDLDGFKQINDTHGHEAGDQALQEFARLLQAAIRQSDLAFRYGGDEFAVLFPETSAPAASAVMKRLAECLSATQGAYGFSWGCATLPDDTPDGIDVGAEAAALVLTADARLYAYKRGKAATASR